MAYTKLSKADVDAWEQEYEDRARDLQGETDQAEQRRLTAEMNELGQRIEERLAREMGVIKKGFVTHLNHVDLWLVSAKREQKEANTLAARYKRHPTEGKYLTQLQDKLKRLGDLEKSIVNDVLDFGDAWFDYRGAVATGVPLKYRQKFQNARAQMMNESKAISTKRQQIVQARREVKALLDITSKAALKRAVKQDPTQARSLQAAEAVVDDLIRRLDKIATEIDHPRGMTSPPNTITTNVNTLEGHATNPNWANVPSNVLLDRGFLKNAEASFKVLNTQATTMANVLATSKRGLRSAELKADNVKAKLVTANQKVTAAKALVKQYAPEVKRAQKAMSKLEANFKAAAKKNKK